MAVAVLGPLEVDGEALRLGRRDRIVLAVLVVRAGRVVTPDELAEAVWRERPPASWQKNLQGCVSRLRRVLGGAAIETSSGGYRLLLAPDVLDIREFERLTERAQELLSQGEPDRAAYTAERALALWRGPPLPDLEDWEVGILEATRLTQLRLAAEDTHLDSLLRAGHHDDVLAIAAAMVEAAPTREPRWVMLALAQYRAGDQSTGLETLRRLRAVLDDELGVEPGQDVLDLEEAILRHDPRLLVDPSERAGDRCPYPGLTAYDEGDADFFFGREVEIARCLELLDRCGVLTVVGPSGVGKSSLVGAGLVPALRARGCEVVTMMPGAQPLESLAEATGGRWGSAPTDPLPILVVDQAEELYALCDDPLARRRFVRAVLDHADRAPVVLVLRADRTGDLAGDPDLARLVERGLFLLGGLSGAELNEAIEGPARQGGLILEPGLIDLLVREVEGEPGALPLLSHVLRGTWLRREGRTLTVSGYRQSGGVRGAVAQSAEELFSRVPSDQRPLMKELMLRLLVPGVEGEPVRARLPRRLVVGGRQHDRLVDQLVAARLVTSDDGVLEIAHESLTRAWPRLRGWLDEDVEGRRTLHHLVAAADGWAGMGRPASELYRGVRLDQALSWRTTAHPDLTTVEREFLDASERAAAAEARSAEDRARAQGRMIRRLRFTLAGAAALLALALVAGLVAAAQSSHARRAAASARSAESTAVARRVGALAQVTDDLPRALLLAVAATRVDPSSSTSDQLAQVLAAHPELIRTGYGGSSAFGRLAVSPDGRSVAAHDTDGHVWLLDADTLATTAESAVGRPVPVFQGSPLEFSRDGAELAVAASPTRHLPVQLLDPHTLARLPVQLGGWPHRLVRVDGIDYSADGARVAVTVDFPGPAPNDAASGVDSTAQRTVLLVWDRSRPSRPVARLHLSGIQGVRLSPDGRIAYTGSPFAAYDVGSGRRLVHNSGVDSFVFFELDPSGRRLVALPYAEGGTDLVVVDTRTGRIVRHLSGLTGTNPWVVSWSPDGRHIAGTAEDGSVVVWDAATGEVEQSISNDDDLTYGLAFSPDGATLYSAGANREVQAWDLEGYRSYLRQVRVPRKPLVLGGNYIRPSPDGSSFAYEEGGLPDGAHQVTFLDVERHHLGRPVRLPDQVWWGAGDWSPDASRFVTGFGNGMVRVLAPGTGAEIRARRTGAGLVTQTAYTADGSEVVVSSQNGDLRILDARTLRPVRPPVRFDEPVLHVATNPRGHTAFVVLGGPAVTWYQDYAATRWALVDTDDGTVLRRGDLGLDGAEVSAFSPDGVHAVAAGRQSQVVVVDTSTGRVTAGPTGRQRGTINWVTYNADGSRFLTGSLDRSARLWDGLTATQVGAVRIPQGLPYGGFRPDGTLLVTSPFAKVYRWDPSAEAEDAFACLAAGRDLDQVEWRAAFGDLPFVDPCPGEQATRSSS